MKVKEWSEKVGLKLSIQRTKIMASGPITSWQIDGETVDTERKNPRDLQSSHPVVMSADQYTYVRKTFKARGRTTQKN